MRNDWIHFFLFFPLGFDITAEWTEDETIFFLFNEKYWIAIELTHPA